MRRLTVCLGMASARPAAVKLRACATAANRRMSSSLTVPLKRQYVSIFADCLPRPARYNWPMAIDVRIEILIRLPRAQVAAFMFEPRNDKVWTSGVVDCRPLTDGP